MKTLFFGLMLLATTSLFAQDNDDRNRNSDRNAQNTVPENVQRTFQNDHPDTRDARWQNENGQWHATYRDRDDKNYDAYYDNEGRRIDRRMDRGDYNQPQLPYKLKRRLDRHYGSDYRVSRMDRGDAQGIYRVTLSDGTVMFYDESGRRRNDIRDERDQRDQIDNRDNRDNRGRDRDRDDH